MAQKGTRVIISNCSKQIKYGLLNPYLRAVATKKFIRFKAFYTHQQIG